MKKFKERMAEKAGFTLVELIVVIAILGILAAVAVPTYSGYIERANDAAAESSATAYLTAAQSAAVLNGTYVTSAKVDAGGKFEFAINSADVGDDVATNFAEFGGAAATNTNGTITTTNKVVDLTGTSYEEVGFTLTVTNTEVTEPDAG